MSDISVNVHACRNDCTRSNWSQNFMDTANRIYLTRICIQMNKNSSFCNHTSIKILPLTLLRKSKQNYLSTLNRKYTRFMKLNTMFRIWRVWTMNIHRREPIRRIKSHQTCFSHISNFRVIFLKTLISM